MPAFIFISGYFTKGELTLKTGLKLFFGLSCVIHPDTTGICSGDERERN